MGKYMFDVNIHTILCECGYYLGLWTTMDGAIREGDKFNDDDHILTLLLLFFVLYLILFLNSSQSNMFVGVTK